MVAGWLCRGYYGITDYFEGIAPSALLHEDCSQVSDSLKSNCQQLFVTKTGHLNREVQVYRGVKLLNLSVLPLDNTWKLFPLDKIYWSNPCCKTSLLNTWQLWRQVPVTPEPNMARGCCLLPSHNSKEFYFDSGPVRGEVWLAKTELGVGVSFSTGAVNHHSVCLR